MASVYNSILNACKTQFDGLSLISGSDVIASKIRKLPAAEEGIDTLPLLCICPDETPEQEEPVGEGLWDVTYHVDLTMISQGNRNLSANLGNEMDWRQQIRNSFKGPLLASVPTVWKTTVVPGQPVDRAKVNDNYDYNVLRVVFVSQERK